jgi:TPR repeat protein/ankyrin repeat protein
VATNNDIIEIDLAFASQKKSAEISLHQRITEWLANSDFVAYDKLLTRLELPVYLYDAQQVTQLLTALRQKSDHTPAELMLFSCISHPFAGLPLLNSLKVIIEQCKAALELTEINDEKSATYVRAAADKGFIPAIYHLGVNNYNGICVLKKDINEAEKLWQIAAAQGLPYASYRLGYLYENDFKDIDKAVPHYLNGAKLNHGASLFELGRLQQNKLIANTHIISSAIEYYIAAAKRGNIKALCALITADQNGISVIPDLQIVNSLYDIYLKQADINQKLLHDKMQLFLASLTHGVLKNESLPGVAINGLCNGYIFMMFRADLIGESEHYLKRLRLLSLKSDMEIKELAQLYNNYKAAFKKLTRKKLSNLEQCTKRCKDSKEINNIRKQHYNRVELEAEESLKLTAGKQKSLCYAKELYIFISSLLFSQYHVNYGIQQNNKLIAQGNYIKILNIIPTDYPISKNDIVFENKRFGPKSSGLEKQSVRQSFSFAFNFLEHELIAILDKTIIQDDYIIIRSTNHSLYLKRSKDCYQFYDSSVDAQDYFSTAELVSKIKFCICSLHNRTEKFLPVGIIIFSHDQISVTRPTEKELIAYIFQQRGNNHNINAQAWDGTTALYMATLLNQVDVVRELLNKGADCTIANQAGITPVQVSVLYDHDGILEMFAQNRANLNHIDASGNDLVHMAVRTESTAALNILKKVNIDLQRSNKDNLTPLDQALSNHKLAVIIELLNVIKGTKIASYDNLNKIRYELLLKFFEIIEDIRNDQEKLNFINAVLESDPLKQNALSRFFYTPTSSVTFFFSTKNKTGCIIKIEQYRDKLIAKMNDVYPVVPSANRL